MKTYFKQIKVISNSRSFTMIFPFKKTAIIQKTRPEFVSYFPMLFCLFFSSAFAFNYNKFEYETISTDTYNSFQEEQGLLTQDYEIVKEDLSKNEENPNKKKQLLIL